MTIVKFFDTPFGLSGTQTTIPDPVQSGGQVSFTNGYGVDYTLAPGAGGVLYPQNGEFNYLMYAITAAIQQWQVHAFPDWIAASDNGGSSYAYDKNAAVRYSGDGNIYFSIINANTSTPGTDPTKWGIFNPFPSQQFKTGFMLPLEDIYLPDGASTSATTTSGFIWANGLTIGNTSSNATGRANSDTQAHFTQIWNAFPNAVRPMVNSGGSPISRGVSAAADWAANNALPVRDMRDVVLAGLSTMGGTSDRGLLTGAYTGGINGAVFGGTGGEQAHTQQVSELVGHTHVQNAGSGTMYTKASGAGESTSSTGSNTLPVISTQSTGGGNPMNVTQPTTIGNWIIKL
jgi:hypothetical protein